ncbi:MAG TPA: transcriptional regulator [Bacillota bacterium]|nr:transcriptional regulator [Bacillota bacterium]
MRNELIKCMKYNNLMDMIYMTNDGHITKRRIRAIKINGAYFQAYCYLRRSVRTFKYCNMLALVPVIKTERMVV